MRIGCLRALIWRRTFCATNGNSSAIANPSQEMRIGCLRALICRRTFCATKGNSSAIANPSQETVVLVDVITHRQNFYGIGICWGADDVRNVGVRLGGSRNDHPGRINAEMQAVNIALYQAITGKLTNVVIRGDLSFAADIVRPVQMETWRQRKWRNKQGSRIIPNARDICEYDALMKMIKPRMDLECTEFDSEVKNISHRLACDAKDTETMTEAVYKTKFHPELYAKIQALLDSDTEYPTPAAIDQFKKRRTILKY